MSAVAVVTLYVFQRLEKAYLVKAKLSDWCEEKDIRGTLIIAEEGVNGTLSGDRQLLQAFVERLSELLGGTALVTKWSEAPSHPFGKLKLPLKPEIVTMGDPKPDPLARVGTYVAAEDWNALISRDDVLLVDTRNTYEVALGTFEGAIDPKTSAFREFHTWASGNLDAKRHKHVAMFCTGGIRCEKASSYLLEQGFESVYHLEGGILKYLEAVPRTASLWRGECFVFDERVSVDHDLAVGSALMCEACGRPVAYAKGPNGPTQCPNCDTPLSAPDAN